MPTTATANKIRSGDKTQTGWIHRTNILDEACHTDISSGPWSVKTEKHQRKTSKISPMWHALAIKCHEEQWNISSPTFEGLKTSRKKRCHASLRSVQQFLALAGHWWWQWRPKTNTELPWTSCFQLFRPCSLGNLSSIMHFVVTCFGSKKGDNQKQSENIQHFDPATDSGFTPPFLSGIFGGGASRSSNQSNLTWQRGSPFTGVPWFSYILPCLGPRLGASLRCMWMTPCHHVCDPSDHDPIEASALEPYCES